MTVGYDFKTSGAEEYFTANGVSTDQIIIDRERLSGNAYLFMEGTGKTMCFSNPGASGYAEFHNKLEHTEYLVLCPVFNSFTKRIFDQAIDANTKIITTGIGDKSIFKGINKIDVVIVNTFEVDFLINFTGKKSMEALSAKYSDTTFIADHITAIIDKLFEHRFPQALSRQ